MNRDIPMNINRLIQAGLNIQLGGEKKGLFNFLYQVGMAGVVKRELISCHWIANIYITVVNFATGEKAHGYYTETR